MKQTINPSHYRDGRRGSAMVEFVILLPIYLLLLLGALYLGQIAFFQEKSLEATRFATHMPGIQSEHIQGQTGAGIVSQSIFAQSPGQLTLRETHEDFPTPIEIKAILTPPENPGGGGLTPHPPSATGHTDIDLDQLMDDLETVVDVNPGHEGQPGFPPPEPPQDPRLINLLTSLLSGWMLRASSNSEYSYTPGYLSLQHLKFKPATPAAEHRIMTRTGIVREVRDTSGQNLAPNLLNKFEDGTAPVPGYPRFGNFSDSLMTPN